MDRQQNKLTLQDCSITDFTTYLNGCTLSKWKQYTNIQNLSLQLKLQGRGRIVLVGYHLDVYSPCRREYGIFAFDTEEVEESKAAQQEQLTIMRFKQFAAAHNKKYKGGTKANE